MCQCHNRKRSQTESVCFTVLRSMLLRLQWFTNILQIRQGAIQWWIWHFLLVRSRKSSLQLCVQVWRIKRWDVKHKMDLFPVAMNVHGKLAVIVCSYFKYKHSHPLHSSILNSILGSHSSSWLKIPKKLSKTLNPFKTTKGSSPSVYRPY